MVGGVCACSCLCVPSSMLHPCHRCQPQSLHARGTILLHACRCPQLELQCARTEGPGQSLGLDENPQQWVIDWLELGTHTDIRSSTQITHTPMPACLSAAGCPCCGSWIVMCVHHTSNKTLSMTDSFRQNQPCHPTARPLLFLATLPSLLKTICGYLGYWLPACSSRHHAAVGHQVLISILQHLLH